MLHPGWRLSLNAISLLHLMRFICSLTDYLSVIKKIINSQKEAKKASPELYLFSKYKNLIELNDICMTELKSYFYVWFLFKPRFIVWINTIIIIVSSFSSWTFFNIKSLNSNPSSSAFRFFRKISKMILEKNESFK